MDVPDVRYTRSGDVAIAYQVVGDGDRDLVMLPFLANIWSFWRLYGFAEFGYRLADGRRLIVINPRGVGLSDRPRGFTIESRMDDIRAVMDAMGIERASVLGLAESAATCAVFAASFPERVDRLVLFTPYLRGVTGDDDRARAAIVASAAVLDLRVRAGIHTGECERIGEKISGIAVVTGARISSLAGPGEVLVSSTVKDLVAGSGFAFEERGEHELKGVPGAWRLYAVADG
jgi:pimeloyl-ACP methyl ester carboxylesterase